MSDKQLYSGPIFEYIARVRVKNEMLRPPLSPQGRSGRAVYLLIAVGPMRADELTKALGYSSRFSIYDLLDNLSQAKVPLYYDERTGVYGILNNHGDIDDAMSEKRLDERERQRNSDSGFVR